MKITIRYQFPFRLMLRVLIGLSQVTGDQVLGAQPCEDCAYYDVTHLSRIEGHPDLGEWDELWTLCVPFDDGRDFRVTAEGTAASKFEVSLVVFGQCIYENEDPMVEFMDENFEPVTDPSPEEYGIITVILIYKSILR